MNFLDFHGKTITKTTTQQYNCQLQIIEKQDKNYLPYSTCFKTEVL